MKVTFKNLSESDIQNPTKILKQKNWKHHQVMTAQLDDDLGNAQKAYEAAVGFLTNKKEECANKAMSYEERKKKREEEIAGLQEALEILSAEE